MAKLRSINTKFWDDSYVIRLTPNEKLLYLYFLTNALTNISGVYEISLERVSFDTGLKDSLLKPILDKFKEDKKITYRDSWLVIHNFIKNQSLNPKIIAGIKIALENAPNWTKTLVKLDRLYIDYDSPSQSNSKSNNNSNSNSAQFKKIQEEKQKAIKTI
jgi:hypothetical protein